MQVTMTSTMTGNNGSNKDTTIKIDDNLLWNNYGIITLTRVDIGSAE